MASLNLTYLNRSLYILFEKPNENKKIETPNNKKSSKQLRTTINSHTPN